MNVLCHAQVQTGAIGDREEAPESVGNRALVELVERREPIVAIECLHLGITAGNEGIVEQDLRQGNISLQNPFGLNTLPLGPVWRSHNQPSEFPRRAS
ncbi:hypothetical protein AAE478_004787 [Parahypoxylon ruwenzoriense]